MDPEGTFVFTGTMIAGIAAVKVGGLVVAYLGTKFAQHFTNSVAGGNMPNSAVNTAMAHSISASAYSGYGGVIAVGGIVNAPAAGRAIMNAARANPGAIIGAVEFIENANPSQTPNIRSRAGGIGYVAGQIYETVSHRKP